MSHPFNARSGPILVDAEISGPTGRRWTILILDTGATSTIINVPVLRSIRYDPTQASDFVQVITGTGARTVPRVMLNRVSALGQHQIGLRVIAHDLPQAADVDGLLGLDFLRDQVLTIDFRAGEISLA